MKAKILLILAGLVLLCSGLNAYYFGQNKVNSTYTRWSQIKTMHFDIYFPAGNDEFGKLAALMSEETYYYLKNDFQFPITSRIPVIFYGSQLEFQTTNIIYPLLSEGVGGFTESLRNRVVVPFTGSYTQLEQVLTHELTHAYINALDSSTPGSFFYIRNYNFPFWLSEGLPEFQAMGGSDVSNNAFILDLVLNDKLRSLTDAYGYSAYRLGESFLIFLKKRYGRDKVLDFFYSVRALSDTDKASKNVFGLSFKDLEMRWRNQLKRDFFPYIQSHTIPNEYSDEKTKHKEDGSFFNLAPRFSPNGQRHIYYSNYNGRFSIWTGGLHEKSINRKLILGETTGKLEEFHYLKTNLAWFPDNNRFAFISKTSFGDRVNIADYDRSRVLEQIKIPNLDVIYEIDISPDGLNMVFSGQKDMQADIYLYDFTTEELLQLTNDKYYDYQPRFSPDGRSIAFASERTQTQENFRKGFFTGLKSNLFTYELLDNSIYQITFNDFNTMHPVWDSTGTKLYYISERDSIANIEIIDLVNENYAIVTKTLSGVYSFDFNPTDRYLVYSCFFDGGWDIYLKTEPLVELVYASAQSPEYHEVFDTIFDRIDLSRLNYYGKRSRRRAVVDTGPDYIYKNSTVIDLQTVKDSVRVRRDYSWDSRPDSITTIPRIKPYKVKMMLDRFWGGFAYSSSVGTIGSLQLGLSDLMGNHAVGINLGISGKIKDSNILLTYLYLPRRTDYGIGVYNILDEYIYRIVKPGNDDYFRLRERETGLYALVRYPLNRFLRLDFENQMYTWERHYDTWVWNQNGIEGSWQNDNLFGVPVKAKDDLIYAPAITLVHDNSLYGPTGPLLGLRAFLTLRKSFAINKNDYQTAYLDLRSYTLFSRRYSLALRGVGGISGGKNPQKFGLDGYYGVRGFEDDLEGRKIAMATAELRVPFMDYFAMAFPLPLVMTQIRGSIFTDVGTVWNKDKDFVGMQDDRLRDVKFGFGYGPRFNIGFAVLKLDFAWLTDFHSTSKPIYYLSLTEDF